MKCEPLAVLLFAVFCASILALHIWQLRVEKNAKKLDQIRIKKQDDFVQRQAHN
jgi:hypothetical protein